VSTIQRRLKFDAASAEEARGYVAQIEAIVERFCVSASGGRFIDEPQI
jgi:hypothetical protein